MLSMHLAWVRSARPGRRWLPACPRPGTAKDSGSLFTKLPTLHDVGAQRKAWAALVDGVAASGGSKYFRN